MSFSRTLDNVLWRTIKDEHVRLQDERIAAALSALRTSNRKVYSSIGFIILRTDTIFQN